MAGARARLEIATQNLANTSSDGFRKLQARGRLTSSGVQIDAVGSFEQGGLRHTGRVDDLAIVGAGTFVVRERSGRLTETRNGAFVRDRFGKRCDGAGDRLVGIKLAPGSSLRSGFLESSDVNPISEMIDVLTAQRSFESAEKTLSSIDQTRQKASNELARLK